MKKIIFLLAVFICSKSFAQHPVGVDSFQLQTLGSSKTLVKSKGAIGSDSGFVNAHFPDTAAANLGKIKNYPGAQIAVGNDIYFRDITATRWILGGAGSDTTLIITIVNDSAQNLQQVTDIGYTTTNPLVTYNSVAVIGADTIDNSNSVSSPTKGVISQNINLVKNPALSWTLPWLSGTTDLFADSADSRQLQLPNNNGVLALSVNGVFADIAGNIVDTAYRTDTAFIIQTIHDSLILMGPDTTILVFPLYAVNDSTFALKEDSLNRLDYNITNYDTTTWLPLTLITKQYLEDRLGGGGGGVTSVTATAPILSSGGTTPNISADTSKSIGRLATFSDVALKVNISDTSAMLASYYNNVAAVTGGFRLYNTLSPKTDTILISVPAQFNPTAGNGMAITGTYPNMTFTALAGDTARWALQGNAGVTNDHFLGPTNNSSLRFRTNNVERAVIDSNGRLGINTILPVSLLEVRNDGLAAAIDSSKGIILSNRTASTAGVTVQRPPAITFEGSAWKSTATAASHRVQYRLTSLPSTGGAAADGTFILQSSINNAAFGNIVTFAASNSFATFSGSIQGNSNITASGNISSSGGTVTAALGLVSTAGITIPTSTTNSVNISGTLNVPSGVNTYRGVYFNPTASQTYGLNLIGFQNTLGNNLFNTTYGSTGIGANLTVDTSAILDITSTTKSFLPPRMTKVQRDAIIGGLEGTLSAGSGQTNTTYSNKAATGGTGTGATFDITVAGGVVTAIKPVRVGSGYIVSDVLSAAGMGGTPFTFTLTVVKKPATGSLIYQTDNTPGLRVYNGTNWMRFTETID